MIPKDMHVLSARELAAAINESRRLWKDADEAPAVRSTCAELAKTLSAKYESFNEADFWRDCGYSVPS